MTVDADYLVVGAGAAGMAFTDALIANSDARVAIIDRRHGAGGHWLDAYSFVRLHQASSFYGVASTVLGDGSVQQRGPEAGLHKRAMAPEICAYYSGVLERMQASGRVTFQPNSDYVGDRQFVSTLSGKRFEVAPNCRVVNANYLSPRIPANTPPPFELAAGARLVPVGELPRVDGAPSQYVIVGSGKTATDACIWLLGNGVDPESICWVRPRDPWMYSRSVVQPDPASIMGMAADIAESATAASSPDDLLLRLESAGVMCRIDRSVMPTMAKTPTLGVWELELLRSVENVVRLGHIREAAPGRLTMDDGAVAIRRDAVIVHCAAPGLRYRPLVPIWGANEISLQPIRTGFPCFGAALAGYVEATRNDDAEKNRLCPPSPFSNTPTDWCRMQVLGYRSATSFGGQPDIKAWADTVALNPSRMPADYVTTDAWRSAAERYGAAVQTGMTRMAQMAGIR